MRINRKGLTFVEVLVAVAVVSLSLVSIFRVFFETISIRQHLKNRIEAQIYLEENKKEIQNIINEKSIAGEYVNYTSEGKSPRFTLISRIKKLRQFNKIYQLEITVSWKEKGRNVSLRRFVYLRKA
ncbi:MAG: prepilin-type N-terminal cleavage/methylation domain-containing protein [Candidatus Omnitrophota bacterium]